MPARTLAALLVAVFAGRAAACPFCSSQGQTLSGEVTQADLIVLGTLANAKQDPGDPTRGTTDLIIKTVVKPHPYLAGKTVLKLPKYLPDGAKGGDTQFLIYGAVFTKPVEATAAAAAGVAGALLADPAGTVFDPYRGVPVDGQQPAAGVPARGHRRPRPGHPDPAAVLLRLPRPPGPGDCRRRPDGVRQHRVQGRAGAGQDAAGRQGDQVAPRPEHPRPAGTGCSACSSATAARRRDAPALRALLDDPVRSKSSGQDGLLAAYILLDPVGGWDYLFNLLKDPAQEFSAHYAGLRTLAVLLRVPAGRAQDGAKSSPA